MPLPTDGRRDARRKSRAPAVSSRLAEAGEEDFERAAALLPRYDERAPRYTSYPTVPVWSESYSAGEFGEHLARLGGARHEQLALYVHVPFCRSLCHFCACSRVVSSSQEVADPYLAALECEARAIRARCPDPPKAESLHLGGGTPTFLTPDQLLRLHGIVTTAFPMAAGAERSIEVDPRSTSERHLLALRDCGFSRISVGVQDFDPHVQDAISRHQSFDQTAGVAESARRLGFESVSFDLIYGLPYQSEQTFSRTIEAVRTLRPDRIALYSYGHVPWVAKQQRSFERKDLPDSRTKLRLLFESTRALLEAGYRQVGMDHFALPDDPLFEALESRTLGRGFMGYTTGGAPQLIGLGPTAISEVGHSFAQSQRDWRAWQSDVGNAGLSTMRGHVLSPEDQRRRWVISQLMCYGEVRSVDYREEFSREFDRDFSRELARLQIVERDGLVCVEPDSSISTTRIGRMFLRNIASVFDAYLSDQRRNTTPVFSQSV